MSLLWSLLHHILLASRLHTVVPALSLEDAAAHAQAATEATATRTLGVIDENLLLAIAYIESRYEPTATSRVVAGRRITGAYPSSTPPRQLDPRASLFCGPLQTYARTWSECAAMRDLAVGYRTGVTELERWLRDPHVRGDLRRALAGYCCGYRGIETGVCNDYPARVLGMQYRIARDAGEWRRPVPPPRRKPTARAVIPVS